MRAGSLGLADARELDVFKQRIPDEGIATITSMIYALDGAAGPDGVLGTVVETVDDTGNVQREATTVRFSKLGLVDQLFHTVASPAVTYLLLLIGLASLVFEATRPASAWPAWSGPGASSWPPPGWRCSRRGGGRSG